MLIVSFDIVSPSIRILLAFPQAKVAQVEGLTCIHHSRYHTNYSPFLLVPNVLQVSCEDGTLCSKRTCRLLRSQLLLRFGFIVNHDDFFSRIRSWFWSWFARAKHIDNVMFQDATVRVRRDYMQ